MHLQQGWHHTKQARGLAESLETLSRRPQSTHRLLRCWGYLQDLALLFPSLHSQLPHTETASESQISQPQISYTCRAAWSSRHRAHLTQHTQYHHFPATQVHESPHPFRLYFWLPTHTTGSMADVSISPFILPSPEQHPRHLRVRTCPQCPCHSSPLVGRQCCLLLKHFTYGAMGLGMI